MTEKEAITAFQNQIPVIYNDGINEASYSKISALIYRLRSGVLELTVELLDKNRNCVSVAQTKKVFIRK